MKRLTRITLVTALVVGAIGLVHCASEEPTQIIVTINATPTECGAIQKTIVRVGTLDDFAAAVSAERAGCTKETNRIGELVFVPKAADNAEVRFQVVTGIAKNPELCRPEESVDCIVAKQATHFVPHQTVRLTVLMAGTCRGRTCLTNETCIDGTCVSVSGEQPVPGCQGAACVDATPGVEAAPPPDTPYERCRAAGCLALEGASCSPEGVCVVGCGVDQGCELKCPPNIQCTFKCEAKAACASVVCDATNPKCTVTCIEQSACKNVDCAAGDCDLTCDRKNASGDARACEQVKLSSIAKNTLRCVSEHSCGAVTCANAKCTCPDDWVKGGCKPANLCEDRCRDE